ncbi:hypothetical protein SAMN04488490_0258 [Marinobacter sp. LV10R510-11A]|uniref:hypothetical protein n=1 Tax=Marinobacter sp. LV10R510-11A TaxID=1415568 RepID=UPI000BB847BA|nr:hypothetical protein [Marinobacter sp. LV10R510-11A]SOB74732.1 hypothetical protein SAMN04488490_0258 [Marinobacter sp. LV10R510-11A]
MEIIKIDYNQHNGINCPITGRFIDFDVDEWENDQVPVGTIIVAILDQESPDQAMFASDKFSSSWSSFYEAKAEINDFPFLDEMAEMYPGDQFKALIISGSQLVGGQCHQLKTFP